MAALAQVTADPFGIARRRPVSRFRSKPFTMDARLRKDLWILDAAERQDAAEAYRQACAHLFDITLMHPSDRFRNRLEGYNLEGAVFGRCEGVAQRFQRGRSHIVTDSSDPVQVILDLDGARWSGDYDGRKADSSQGTVRVIDMARPFDVTTGPFRTLNLTLPRALLGAHGYLDLHGLVASEDSAGGRLLGSHLRALWAVVETMTPAEAAGAVAACAALVSSLLAVQAPERSAEARPLEKILLANARVFVDGRLGDPGLSPDVVRLSLGVSRSLLYRVFEPMGGVSSFIQARRLDRAFDAIIADDAGRRTLAEIGYAHGFNSDAHFNRMFKSRFGMPPGRLRRLGARARTDGLSAAQRPDDVWAWLKNL